MAIAPPFGLSLPGSAPVLASQASGTGANASLTSNTPMSSTDRPDFFSALWVAGIGALSMMTGLLVASTAVCTRAIGVRPSSRARSEGHHQHGRGAVADLRGVTRVDEAVLLEGGLQPGQLLRGGPPAQALVGVDDLAIRQFDRGDLGFQGSPCRSRRPALACEALENSSSWSRVRLHFSAIISAPMPWLKVTLVAFPHLAGGRSGGAVAELLISRGPGADRHRAHHLHAVRQHGHVVLPGDQPGGGEVDRLLG